MNHSEVIELLADVREAFPNQPMSDSTVRLWTRTLGDLEYQVTRQALDQWIVSEQWPPTIAAIRNAVLDTTSGLPTPAEAWQMVQHRIKSTYPGMPAETWDAPGQVQAAARDVGGIYLIRQAEKPDAMRQRFEDAYRRRRDAHRREAAAIELGDRIHAHKELT